MSGIAVLMMFVILIVTGCSKTKAQISKRGVRQQNHELVAALGSEPETGFDTTQGSHGTIMRLFFSTLFKRDHSLNWIGDLASGYTVSEDCLSWTVKLRDDAVFSDGSAVTAEDVIFTYETAKVAASEIDLTMIESIQRMDDVTVEFHLVRPFSTFQERLSTLGIMPKHAYNEEFWEKPIGSGPYQLVQWDKGQQIIAERNPSYYGERPCIEKLTIVFMDTDTAYEAFKCGDIDVMQINGAMADNNIENAHIVNLESIECYGVCFPMQPACGRKARDGAEIGNDVTCDVAVRKAFNLAVDRKKMVKGILNGYGTVSTTGLEKMPWLNEETVLPESTYGKIEDAKNILTKAGWVDTDQDGYVEKNGKKAKFHLLYTEGRYRQEFALEFVNTGKKLGIDVTMELVTWNTIVPKIHKDAVLYGFGSGDPSELYNLYYGGCAGGEIAWDNSGCYDNSSVNQCIDEALNAKDEKDAMKYWKELQFHASAAGDAPYCWFVNVNHVFLASDGFEFGNPVIQPHGGRIFDNVTEWSWK